MSRSRINMKIQGDGIFPENLDIEIFSKIFTSLKAALIAESRADLDEDQGRFPMGLTSISSGSVGVSFAVPQHIKQTYRETFKAVNRGEIDRLRMETLRQFRAIQKICMHNHLAIEFYSDGKGGPVLAAISAESDFSLKPPSAYESRVSIYGELIRIGGRSRPEALIEMADGHKVDCAASEDIAKELAPRLYTQIGVSGLAFRNLATFEIVKFKILEVLPYREDTNMAEALQRIRELSHGAFDGVDAIAYVRDLRGD